MNKENSTYKELILTRLLFELLTILIIGLFIYFIIKPIEDKSVPQECDLYQNSDQCPLHLHDDGTRHAKDLSND